MSRPAVPIIDLAPYRSGTDRGPVVDAVRDACEQIGFLIIIGHGVDREVDATTHDVTRRFFALPDDVKRRSDTGFLGSSPIAAETLSQSLDVAAAPDMKESFTVRRPHTTDDEYSTRAEAAVFFAPNVWPDEPDGFEAAWVDWYDEMSQLSLMLLDVFAEALELPSGYFDHTCSRHVSTMRALSYPAVDALRPEQFWATEHTDYGSFTILSDDGPSSGLQVRRDGRWLDVPAVPDDALVVNLGDLMALWVNDSWVSTMHRAVPSEADLVRRQPRQTLVFFHQPDYDAVIEPVPTRVSAEHPAMHSAVISGQHLMAKVTKQKQ